MLLYLYDILVVIFSSVCIVVYVAIWPQHSLAFLIISNQSAQLIMMFNSLVKNKMHVLLESRYLTRMSYTNIYTSYVEFMCIIIQSTGYVDTCDCLSKPAQTIPLIVPNQLPKLCTDKAGDDHWASSTWTVILLTHIGRLLLWYVQVSYVVLYLMTFSFSFPPAIVP